MAAIPGLVGEVSSRVDARLEMLRRLLGIVADEKRFAIISLLIEGEQCVCEIVNRLQWPQSLVSHHLAVLRNKGLVIARRDEEDARWVYYRLNKAALAELNRAYLEHFDVARISDDRVHCDRYGNQWRSS